MSHFSHTNFYFIREDEEDTLNEKTSPFLAAAEFEEESDDDSDDIDGEEAV
ncbi:hypothetical protein BH10PAT2_BH10PAT2_1430 [soil metagenome]